jgi:hypothetical protein
MDTINKQMNTLVEEQAKEIKELKKKYEKYDKIFTYTTDTIKEISLMNDKKDFMRIKGMCILSLKENEYCFELYNNSVKMTKEIEELKELVEDLHGRHMEDCVRDGKQDRDITRLKEEMVKGDKAIECLRFMDYIWDGDGFVQRDDEIEGLPPNTGKRM